MCIIFPENNQDNGVSHKLFYNRTAHADAWVEWVDTVSNFEYLPNFPFVTTTFQVMPGFTSADECCAVAFCEHHAISFAVFDAADGSCYFGRYGLSRNTSAVPVADAALGRDHLVYWGPREIGGHFSWEGASQDLGLSGSDMWKKFQSTTALLGPSNIYLQINLGEGADSNKCIGACADDMDKYEEEQKKPIPLGQLECELDSRCSGYLLEGETCHLANFNTDNQGSLAVLNPSATWKYRDRKLTFSNFQT